MIHSHIANAEASRRITERIASGEELAESEIASLDDALMHERTVRLWDTTTYALLASLCAESQVPNSYARAAQLANSPPNDVAQYNQGVRCFLKSKVSKLKDIVAALPEETPDRRTGA